MTIFFDMSSFLFACCIVISMAIIAFVFADENPNQKRLVNVEKLLVRNTEDAKITIETVQKIEESNQTIIKILTK